ALGSSASSGSRQGRPRTRDAHKDIASQNPHRARAAPNGRRNFHANRHANLAWQNRAVVAPLEAAWAWWRDRNQVRSAGGAQLRPEWHPGTVRWHSEPRLWIVVH